MHARRPPLTGESGQTFVEWLGVIVFVVVVVGILAAMAPGIGHAIVGVLKDALNAVGA